MVVANTVPQNHSTHNPVHDQPPLDVKVSQVAWQFLHFVFCDLLDSKIVGSPVRGNINIRLSGGKTLTTTRDHKTVNLESAETRIQPAITKAIWENAMRLLAENDLLKKLAIECCKPTALEDPSSFFRRAMVHCLNHESFAYYDNQKPSSITPLSKTAFHPFQDEKLPTAKPTNNDVPTSNLSAKCVKAAGIAFWNALRRMILRHSEEIRLDSCVTNRTGELVFDYMQTKFPTQMSSNTLVAKPTGVHHGQYGSYATASIINSETLLSSNPTKNELPPRHLKKYTLEEIRAGIHIEFSREGTFRGTAMKAFVLFLHYGGTSCTLRDLSTTSERCNIIAKAPLSKRISLLENMLKSQGPWKTLVQFLSKKT